MELVRPMVFQTLIAIFNILPLNDIGCKCIGEKHLKINLDWVC
jgi:hypothetical protein